MTFRAGWARKPWRRARPPAASPVRSESGTRHARDRSSETGGTGLLPGDLRIAQAVRAGLKLRGRKLADRDESRVVRERLIKKEKPDRREDDENEGSRQDRGDDAFPHRRPFARLVPLGGHGDFPCVRRFEVQIDRRRSKCGAAPTETQAIAMTASSAAGAVRSGAAEPANQRSCRKIPPMAETPTARIAVGLARTCSHAQPTIGTSRGTRRRRESRPAAHGLAPDTRPRRRAGRRTISR